MRHVFCVTKSSWHLGTCTLATHNAFIVKQVRCTGEVPQQRRPRSSDAETVAHELEPLRGLELQSYCNFHELHAVRPQPLCWRVQPDLKHCPPNPTSNTVRPTRPQTLSAQPDLKLCPPNPTSNSVCPTRPPNPTSNSVRPTRPQTLSAQPDLKLCPPNLTSNTVRPTQPQTLSAQPNLTHCPPNPTSNSVRPT